MTAHKTIKTGADPRALPDYAALRDELSKLTHPARPDVEWQKVERLCLALFEQNGVELQTAAWYTLARTQLAGLAGLNEGLSVLEALISYNWGTLWPQPIQARMAILSGMSLRLQQRIRVLPLDHRDLSQLYLAEQQLTRLSAHLQRLAVKHLSQLDSLLTLIHNGAVRLENSDSQSCSDALLSPEIALDAPDRGGESRAADGPDSRAAQKRQTPGGIRCIYDPQSQPQPNVTVLTPRPAPVKAWGAFAAGMGTMLIVGALAAGGWYALHRPDPLRAQLAASLAPLPIPLTAEQRDRLGEQAALLPDGIGETQQQLIRLGKLSPDWSVEYSQQLIEQAQALWPQQANPLALSWQQQLNATALPTDQLNGWHQGMMKLQQLSERLNKLDGQKGKYITVSELKSVIFSSIQSFNQRIPAEEQLRTLSQTPAGQPLPAAEKTALETHLKQLIARYAVIKKGAAGQSGQ